MAAQDGCLSRQAVKDMANGAYKQILDKHGVDVLAITNPQLVTK